MGFCSLPVGSHIYTIDYYRWTLHLRVHMQRLETQSSVAILIEKFDTRSFPWFLTVGGLSDSSYGRNCPA